jgi:hypothetical protein
VVEDGVFKVTKPKEQNGSDTSAVPEPPLIVHSRRGDAFGEQYLVLKADVPLKVECVQNGTLWKINRQTFRCVTRAILLQII